MKNVILLLATLFMGAFGAHASHPAAGAAGNDHPDAAFGYGNSFIFVENGITFSVFPDGEFDFYVNDTPYAGAQVNIGFNAGYNYNHYLQYDDYGAVIQVINTPVFYDYYGRVVQIGSVRIFYNNSRVIRIGGLHVYYNPYGVYSHCSGYINIYNKVYVYQPFHSYFIRPVTQFCMVAYQPYRQYYVPVRYTYYKPYNNNARICYATIGKTYYYKESNAKKVIYKNDKRVSVNNYAAKASRRDVAREDSKNMAEKKYTNPGRKTSKRGNAKSYRKPAENKAQGNVSKRSGAVNYKERSHSAPVKQYKASVRESQYGTGPARTIKTTGKSSAQHKSAVPGTRESRR
ncbi:MAG: hypothetical protein KDD04_05245, partial [Sinomicrobium sp.]|nr:hypothetical protein [Sinomicrobium sp.]